MKEGDTFYIRGEKPVEHLWVIVSSPEIDSARIMIVHITTYEDYKDDSCMRYSGDHPRIHHDTCIAYERARFVSLEHLEELKTSGKIKGQPRVSHEVLQKIRDGAALSQRLGLKYVEFLQSQGFIDW